MTGGDLEKPTGGSPGRAEKVVAGVSLNVLLLGFVSFFNDVSSEMITTVLPLFLISIGAGGVAIGVVVGLSNAVANVVKGLSGWLSDKFRRRKAFAFAGYAISNASKPLMGVQTAWQGVLGLKVLDRVGKGVRVAPRDALISHYSTIVQEQLNETSSRSGRSFGVHRMMDTSGAILGSLLASLLVLLVFGRNYGAVILWSLAPGLLALVFMVFVKDVKLEESTPADLDGKSGKPRKDSIPRSLVKLLLALSVMEFASVDVAFLIVRANQMMPGEWVPFLYTGFNCVYAGFAVAAGRLGDKWGKQRTIVLGLVVLVAISAVMALPLPFSTASAAVATSAFVAFGVYMAIVDVGSKAFVSDVTGKDKKGRAYGLYYLFVGLLSIPESLLFGYLYEALGFTVAFTYAAVLLACCVVIFALSNFDQNAQ
ncbi:MAG: MFS transporter [Promethearchaeota archaeon]